MLSFTKSRQAGKNLSLLFIAFLFLQPTILAQQVSHSPNNSYQDASKSSYLSSGVDTAWVRHYASGLVSGEDNVTAMVVDAAGNIYLSGYCEGSIGGDDYLTVKYDDSGVEQWAVRYNGPGNGFDRATSIGIDEVGNVYVSGGIDGEFYRGVRGGYRPGDYGTIKYNTAGEEQWMISYNGQGNGGGEVTSLAVDPSGNVYVTGNSATIKYNSSGIEQWIAQDAATAIAIDEAGNVYVTGTYGSAGDLYNYRTIKYNMAGIKQWTAFYDGLVHDRDEAYALALDDFGNVYVTGRSIRVHHLDYDYATVKYNSSGVEQWAARYDGGEYHEGGKSLAVDLYGNVYVTGNSGTIKYNSSGDEQWVVLGDRNDIVIDDSSNVFVTGSSEGDYITIKYNILGVEQWVVTYNGPGNDEDNANKLTIDGAGNIYVTGDSKGLGTESDYTTIKYNTFGTKHWVVRYNTTGYSSDYATALAIDNSDNVYVTGYSQDSYGYDNYATIKYKTSGEEQWVARYNGYGSGPSRANAIGIDDSGNIYVTGESCGLGIKSDYATIKYNSSGIEQWVARYSGPGDETDEALAITIDGSGNSYVTGRSWSSPPYYDYVTIKYNASGVEQWVVRHNSQTYFSGAALDVDGSGNLFVTGSCGTIKYNSLGVVQWIVPSNGNDLICDESGNIYVTGIDEDYATIKYNASGVEQWVAIYNSDYGEAYNITLDKADNVYVTGTSYDDPPSSDYVTIKYNSSGVEQWIANYEGNPFFYFSNNAITVDSSGNVYMAGSIKNSDGTNDYITIKYNSAGEEEWVIPYGGPLGYNYHRGAAEIDVDGSGNVYMMGTNCTMEFSEWVYGELGWTMYTTIKYTQTTVSVEVEQSSIPDSYSLAQNFPNPFNPSTKIIYSIPQSSNVVVKVFDILCNEIETLVNEEKPAGYYEINWYADNLPSGVYFYRIQAGNFIKTKKMLLLK